MDKLVITDSKLVTDRYDLTGIKSERPGRRVFRAVDRQYKKRVVAIKEFIPEVKPDADRLLPILAGNFNALSALSIKEIPDVYQYFFEKGRLYVVTRWINARSLEEMMLDKEKRLTRQMILDLYVKAAELLNRIRRARGDVTFGSLRPSNILIDSDGKVYLTNSGLYEVLKELFPSRYGIRTGFTAPEILEGDSSPSAGLYSLSAIVWSLLTGRDPAQLPPFCFPPGLLADASVPGEIALILEKCLRFDPSQRKRNGGKVASQVQKFLKSTGKFTGYGSFSHCPICKSSVAGSGPMCRVCSLDFALYRDGKDADYYREKGEAELKKENPVKADRYFYQALRLGGPSPEILMGIAGCRRRIKGADSYLMMLRSISKRFPDYLPARLRIIEGLRDTGENELATAWETALERDFADNPRFILHRIRKEEKEGRSGKALELADEAVRKFEGDSALIEEWIRLHYSKGLFEEIKDEAVRLKNRDRTSMTDYYIGLYFLESGKRDGALTYFNSAVMKDKRNYQARLKRGEFFAAKINPMKAIDEFLAAAYITGDYERYLKDSAEAAEAGRLKELAKTFRKAFVDNQH